MIVSFNSWCDVKNGFYQVNKCRCRCRFIDDIFSLWDIFKKEVFNFVDFVNTFHPTIKFTYEISSEGAVFLDTEVFKGPRLPTHKILHLRTHFKPTETFQYTHF